MVLNMRAHTGRIAFITIAILILTGVGVSTLAQEATPHTELAACTDLSPFVDVATTVNAELSSVAQSAPIAFSITVENRHEEPLHDLAVGVWIHRENDRLTGIEAAEVAENVTLAAGETRTFSYLWAVPAEQQPGTYEISPVLSAGGFETYLPGYGFTIVGEDVGTVSFRSLSFNERTTNDSQEWVFAEDSEDIKVSLTNTRALDESATITWKLYRGSVTDESQRIDTRTETVLIQSGEEESLSYMPSNPLNSGAYSLIAVLETNHGSRVILRGKFMSGAPNEVHLERLGVVRTEAGPHTYVCFSSLTGSGSTNKLTLRVEPSILGWLLGERSTTHEGPVPRGLYALSIPLSFPGDFVAVAEVHRDSGATESIQAEYSCRDAGTCRGYGLTLLLTTLVSIGVAVLLFAYLRRTRTTNSHL